MPNIKCDRFSTCFDPSNPLTNYSAEAPDNLTYLGFHWPWVDPNNPVGNDTPTNYSAQGCQSVCESSISQADADLCAARQAFICSHTGGPGNPIPPPVFFYSNLQVCNMACPDGSIFSYRVLPGAFVNLTQAAADEQASELACDAGRSAMFCLSNLPGGCFGQDYAAIIQASGPGSGSLVFSTFGSLPQGLAFRQTGFSSAAISGTIAKLGNFTFTIDVTQTDNEGNAFAFTTGGALPPNLTFVQTTPNTLEISGTVTGLGSFKFDVSASGLIPITRSFTFAVTAGALPDGLSLTQATQNSALLAGTLTTPGSYQFTIRATESNGNFMERTYTLGVLQISNSPTTANVGSPYSFQFNVTGGTAPYTFVLEGALPAGLTMSSSGLISGTPTTAETTNFTVTVTDSP